MTFDKKRYPTNWADIRARVLERAGHCCEGSPDFPHCRARNYELHPVTGSRVVLTIAHKHGTSKKTQRLSDLMCLCQRCHLTYDAEIHRARRKRTFARRRTSGMQPLPGL